MDWLKGVAVRFAGFNLPRGTDRLPASAGSDTGGHHAAAGLKIHREGIDEFRAAFSHFVAENHAVRPG